MPENHSNISIVIVTYKRQELLKTLFDSICQLTIAPEHVVVVDNENSFETQQLTETPSALTEFTHVHYVPMLENTGGAGGFSKGVETAYNLGAEWIWVMDDDVRVFPNALEMLGKWTTHGLRDNHLAIQPQRENFDGAPFYWQYDFRTGLGIPNPVAPAAFLQGETYRVINTACFEGGLFHRELVKQIGFPDKRFFIYWDDTIYGYLASKVTQPILIQETVMARTRTLEHVTIGKIRRLNSTSDMARYHILRNRGYMAHYFREHGDYKPLIFGFGTFLTVAKEVIRIFALSDNKAKSFSEVRRGLKDGKQLRKDKNWRPMPKID
ncbi:MAG: glycosyltransferase [Streptococcaceae bacterium]|jgi:GT2 family glycosyltransferase|nr:glycosyltransferase [Streptococcaceae bacterium]